MDKIQLKDRLQTSLIIMSFFLLTVLITFPLWAPHQMVVASDWTFHASRVEEIYRNLQHGHPFTFIATTTFHQTGVGSFLFYPTLFLYPWALLRFLFSPITAFYGWYAIITFCTLLISYFSMVHITKSKLKGLIFALLYTLNPYRLYLGTVSFVIGEFVASTFIPLAFLGLYEILWGNRREWYILGIAMALLLNSHILSNMLIVEFFVLIFVTNCFINSDRIIINTLDIVKAAILSLLLSLQVVIPFVTDFIGKNISSAYKGIGILVGTDMVWKNSIANAAVSSSIGIISLATIIVGWKFFNARKIVKYSYILGIIAVLISTSVFPWQMLKNTFFTDVQLPWRYLIYADFFLSIVATYIISDQIQLRNQGKFCKCLIYCSIFIVTIGFALGSLSEVIGRNRTDNVGEIRQLHKSNVAKIPYMVRINNNNYEQQFKYCVKNGETDYFPKKSLRYTHQLLNHVAIINGKKKILKPYVENKKIVYKINVKKKSVMDVPAVAYSNTSVRINKRASGYRVSDRGTVEVNIKTGFNRVEIYYKPKLVYWFGISLSVATWFVVVVSLFFKAVKAKQIY